VATRRRPPLSAAMSTPVRMGRASSELAAGTTWDRASDRSAPARVTACSAGAPSRGNSSAGSSRMDEVKRPEVIWASSPSTAISTRPESRDRTTSEAILAGMTATPSAWPATWVVTDTVRSRSLPVSRRVSPSSSRRTPDSTGRAPPRLATARPAVPRASTSSSRSQRNFTVVARFLCGVQSSSGRGAARGVGCNLPQHGGTSGHWSRGACGWWTTHRRPWSGPVAVVPRRPQRSTVGGRRPRMAPPSSTAGPRRPPVRPRPVRSWPTRSSTGRPQAAGDATGPRRPSH